MLNIDKYKDLRTSIFNIAWNSDFVDPQKDQNIDAFRLAVDIINNYQLESRDTNTNHSIFHLYNRIKIIKARKANECHNNLQHGIKPSDYYAEIIEGEGISSWSGQKLCLSCSSKIILFIISNFPPSDEKITYINNTLSENID